MSYINPSRYFPDKLTYWQQTVQSGYGSESWNAPRVIPCRWEDEETERLSVAYRAEGEALLSNAHIYTDELLSPGSYVYHGISLATNPSRVNKSTAQKAFVVRSVKQTVGLRGEYTENIALC